MNTRSVSVVVCATAVCTAVVILLDGRPQRGALAQESPPLSDSYEPVTETAEPNPTIEPGPPPHDPFTPYPADEGALTWNDLSAEEQVGAEAMQEWAETANGAAVHNAFAAAAATTSELREVAAAQTASGLVGYEALGVVP